MRILLDDGMQIALGTGIGRYSQYLYEALAARDDVEIDLTPWQASSESRKANRIAYLKYINSNDFQKLAETYDAVIFTNYAIPYRKLPCKVMGCIPDMVSYLYPETLPLPYRVYNRAMIRNTVRRSDIVMTISRSVRDEIVERYPECEAKVTYAWLGVYEGIHRDDNPPPYENEQLSRLVPGKYFLFVSTIEKRKNVGFVLDAFLKTKQTMVSAKEYKIVFAGKLGFGGEEYVEAARNSDFADDIVFAGYVSDSDLNRLYNEASALIFPTVYEGFGFAQIECISARLPIILSNIPTNREISRDYGLYFELSDIHTLVDAMDEILEGKVNLDVLNTLAEQYLQDFSWSKTADYYVSTISKCIES